MMKFRNMIIGIMGMIFVFSFGTFGSVAWGQTVDVAWTAADQNPGGGWTNSSWSNMSFRILLEGTHIGKGGSMVQLTLQGRGSGNYTVQRVSLVQRDGSTLNGVDSTFQQVTFGSTWDVGVMVPAGGTVMSDPIPFDLVAGQDVFVTYWVPPGNPTIYRSGATTEAWIVDGGDQSGLIDWGSLSNLLLRPYIYVAAQLDVVSTGGGIAPSITSQPADVTVTEPNSATFTVVATGDAPLSYQWRRNGTPIGGAISASYTLASTSVAADNGAVFDVMVSNASGNVISNPATLTVTGPPTPPTILTQPADVTVTEPNSATFTVVASGSAPLSYQWRRNGTPIGGATSMSYTLASTSMATDNGAVFDVIVTNDEGNVTSNGATLTVQAGGGGEVGVAWTAVDQNPSGSWSNSSWANMSFRILLEGSHITKNGSTVQLTLHGRDSGNYTVQRVSLVQRDGTTVNGVDSTFRQVTFGSTWNAGVTVPAGGTVTSDSIPFDLVAGHDVFVTYWVPSGNSTVYRPGGSDTEAWIMNGSDQSGLIDWGSLSNLLDRPYIYVADQLEVVGTGGGGAPVIITQPADVTVTEPNSATFSVLASGTDPLNYQWRRNGTPIMGATSTSYTLSSTSVSSDNGATFDVMISNGDGNVTSRTATLTVNPMPSPPTIETQPANVTVTAPGSATFSVVATGTGTLSYQWLRNGTPISGATNASYTLSTTSVAADNGAAFDVVVTNDGGSVTSNMAILTVQSSGGGELGVAWTALDQIPVGSWTNSSWANMSFRVLLQGINITKSGSTVQLSLRGRSSGDYIVQRVSLVRRDGATLNGVDSTFRQVTFGQEWSAGITVPAGGTVTSDPIPFDLLAGQDVFVTYWVPSENPTIYRGNGNTTMSWIVENQDFSTTIDWEGLGNSITRPYDYIIEQLEVVSPGSGGPLKTKIMPLGDSITEGAWSTDAGGYRRGLYLALTGAGQAVNFVGTLSDGIPDDFDKDHEGHGGWAADQVRDALAGWLWINRPDIILLHIGSNDINYQNQDAAGVQAEVGQILDLIDQYEIDAGQNVTVILARIINQGDPLSPKGLVMTAYNIDLQNMADTRIAAGDHLIVVDMEHALIYPQDLYDGHHPNDGGYAKMAAVWFQALQTLLGIP